MTGTLATCSWVQIGSLTGLSFVNTILFNVPDGRVPHKSPFISQRTGAGCLLLV